MAAFFETITPRLPVVFSLAKPSHWRDALGWLGYTLFGGLLPFWGTALILWFLHRGQGLGAYVQNGEMAVFCAGVLASAIPLMQRRVKDAPVEHPASLNFLALLLIAVALLLFASVTITRQVTIGSAAAPLLLLNGSAVVVVSFLLLILSVALGFFVELTNNVRVTREDLQAFDDRRETSLSEKFNEARGGQA